MVVREEGWREQWGRMNKKDRTLVHKNVTMSLTTCMIIQTLIIKSDPCCKHSSLIVPVGRHSI